jgi:hypothetical protein
MIAHFNCWKKPCNALVHSICDPHDVAVYHEFLQNLSRKYSMYSSMPTRLQHNSSSAKTLFWKNNSIISQLLYFKLGASNSDRKLRVKQKWIRKYWWYGMPVVMSNWLASCSRAFSSQQALDVQNSTKRSWPISFPPHSFGHFAHFQSLPSSQCSFCEKIFELTLLTLTALALPVALYFWLLNTIFRKERIQAAHFSVN